MDAQQVTEVMTLSNILESFAHTPEGKAHLIVALMDWKNGPPVIQLTAENVTPKLKGGKVVKEAPDDEPEF